MRLRRWAGIALLGLLGLLTWEVLARVEDWWSQGASPWRPYTSQVLFRGSPVGRVGVPHARFGKWHMNGLGFRGEEPLPGRDTVLVFGASETFGQNESPGHEYPRLLAEELQRRFPGRFDVQNAALPGIRVGRDAYLRRAIGESHAAWVVIYPSPANYIGVERPFCGRPVEPFPSGPGWTDQVRIAGKPDQLAKRTVPEPMMTALRQAKIGWAVRREPVEPRVAEATIQVFRTDLECAVDEVLAQGALPLLVTHATYFGDEVRPEDRPWLVAWRSFYPTLAEGGFLDLERRTNDVVRDVALRRGLPLFDAAREVPRGPGHFADFVHFTDEGARVMAQGVAGALAQRVAP
jgi:hypothetical protein